MLCQNCHKNEATIHIQQIVNGHIKSIHLCEECAAKKNGGDDPEEFNLAEVLFDIAGKVANAAASSAQKKDADDDPDSGTEPDVVCPKCGWTLSRFRKTAYLGCPDCYKVFSVLVDGILKNMHRGVQHLGKIPLSAGREKCKSHELLLLKREIDRLQGELEEKIRREEYESAAVLRDRIRELERKIDESGAAS